MKQEELNQLLVKVATDSQVGVIVTDSSGLTVWVNNFIVKMTGYSFGEFVGKPPGELLQGPETNSEHVHRIQKGLNSGQSFETEILNYTKKGSKFWVNLQIDPVRNVRSEIVYFLGVQHDITEMMEKNEQLENFNYLTTHDLVNQVGNLYNLISMLPNEGFNKSQFKMLSLIEVTALKLKNTTKDLRTLLSFEGNLKELHIESFHLVGLIKEVYVTLETDFMAQGVKYEYDIDSQLKVNSSKLLLTSIFSNLMSNAIKYRDPVKDPQLSIVASQHKEKVIIKFIDNGLGIDLKRHRDKLFKAFKTFHANPEAIGIGLYLTKKQLDVLGGSISAISEPGVGSTFCVELPLE